MSLDLTDRQMAEGRRLLGALLPALRKEVSLSRSDDVLQPRSAVGQSLMGRIGFENLDALVIRRSAGGWHADVILTGLPLGVSNVMGTPEADPLPDREAALEAGTGILRQLCRLAMENALASRDTAQDDIRPFELHGYTFEILGPMVDQIAQVWNAMGRSLIPDAETARANLVGTLVELMGQDRFDPDLFDALPDGDKNRIGINMATLLLFGEFRHPDRPQAEPAPEGAPDP